MGKHIQVKMTVFLARTENGVIVQGRTIFRHSKSVSFYLTVPVLRDRGDISDYILSWQTVFEAELVILLVLAFDCPQRKIVFLSKVLYRSSMHKSIIFDNWCTKLGSQETIIPDGRVVES